MLKWNQWKKAQRPRLGRKVRDFGRGIKAIRWGIVAMAFGGLCRGRGLGLRKNFIIALSKMAAV